MEIKYFQKLPVYAVDIRNEVFVKEQGFTEEFDSDDKTAIHIVGFIDGRSAATCRIKKTRDDDYLIGRIAVRKAYRGRGFGAEIVAAAEQVISAMGGRCIHIHSQLQASGFYEKIGYNKTGEVDEEEGCPHCMMIKFL